MEVGPKCNLLDFVYLSIILHFHPLQKIRRQLSHLYISVSIINMPAQEVQQPQAQQMAVPPTTQSAVTEQPVSPATVKKK